MRGYISRQWHNDKRFVVAVVALIVILLVTLVLAIASYVNAFTRMTTQLGLAINGQDVELIDPKETTSLMTPSVSETSDGTVTTESEATTDMKATITTDGETSVTINGTPVEVPENGIIQQEVSNGDSTSSVNIKVQSSSSDTSSDRSKVNIKLKTSSEWSSDE